jgi:tetratricopeptide (TPR) repeat protein
MGPPSYMLLGVALARLDDPDNAAAAYERALQLAPDELLLLLNYGADAMGTWDVGQGWHGGRAQRLPGHERAQGTE